MTTEPASEPVSEPVRPFTLSDLSPQWQARYPAARRKSIVQQLSLLLLFCVLFVVWAGYDVTTKSWGVSHIDVTLLAIVAVVMIVLLMGWTLWSFRQGPTRDFDWTNLLTKPERQQFNRDIKSASPNADPDLRAVELKWCASILLRSRNSKIALALWCVMLVVFALSGMAFYIFLWIPAYAPQVWVFSRRKRAQRFVTAAGHPELI